MRKLLLSTLFLTLTSLVAIAQTDCELVLTKAQEEFDGGRFYAVPSWLEDCLSKNTNREWRRRAYVLLAETYLLLENLPKADESYLNVLRADPEFETDEKRDPIDLVYLSKKFTASPIFSVHGRFGLNTSFIRVLHNVRTSGYSNVQESYLLRAGWQGGIGADYHHTEKWSVATELNFGSTSYTHRTKNLFQEGSYTLDFNDRQTWFSIPLFIKYNHPGKLLTPFAYAGHSVNLLLSDKADMLIDGDIESPVIDIKKKRNTINRSLIVGAGLKYKWGLRYLFGEVRYSLGLTNLVNPDARFDQLNQSWPYVDDDFRMDNVYVSLGYIHPFYKPRMLKKARTKSVLRKTRRADATVR